MATFNYTAAKPNGSIEKGMVSATDIKDAAQQVRQKNLRIVKITESVSRGNSIVSSKESSKGIENPLKKMFKKGLSLKDKALFTNQLGNMLNSGLSITRALDVLSKQSSNKIIQDLTIALKKSIESGLNLSGAMKEYPDIFDSLYISMVKAGEGSGSLGDSLLKMAVFEQRDAEIRAKVKSAMSYPIIVLSASVGIVLILFIFVLPKFVGFLTGMGVALPAPTKITLAISDFLVKKWYIIFGVLGVLIFSIRAVLKTPKGIHFKDDLLVKMPIIGPLTIKTAMSRFTDTVSTLFGAGVPLVSCLEMTQGGMGNTVVEATIGDVITLVKGGESLSGALSKTKFFTPMVIQMTNVGEESGSLEKMLSKVAEFYVQEVRDATDGLTAAINPILMIGVGLMIGWVLISLYLPIFTMAGGIS
jgi:type IV pilus assembly protein PilC